MEQNHELHQALQGGVVCLTVRKPHLLQSLSFPSFHLLRLGLVRRYSVETTTEALDTNVDVPAEPDDDNRKAEEQTTESSTRGTALRGRQSSRSMSNKSLDDVSSEKKDSSRTPAPEVSSSTLEEQEESVSEESVQSTPRSREYVRRKNIINYSSAEQTTEATTSTSTARTREYVRRKYNINYSSTEKTVQSSTESIVDSPRTRQYVRRKNKINYSSEEQTTEAEPAKNHRSREFTRARHSTRSKKEQVSEVRTTTESNLGPQADTPVENIPKSESVNITAIKSKHRYSSKFRSNLFLAKATSTPSPNDVAQTTEMSEQEASRRLREKFPLLSSRQPNKRPRWFTSTTPISDLVAAPASDTPSLLTSTDPIEHNDYTEANFAQETMAEPIVDASFTTVLPEETSTPEKKPTMISFVLHTPAVPVEETVEEQKYPEYEAGTINLDVIDNSLITTTESTNEVINNLDNEIQTEIPRFSQEVEQTSQYVTEANSNQVTEANTITSTTTEPIVSSTSRFIVKNGILLLNTEPTPMKTDKKSIIRDQSLEDLLLNQIVSAVAAATNEVTTSYPSVTQHSTLTYTVPNNSNSEFSIGNSYKPIAYSTPSIDHATYVRMNYTSISTSSTTQVPVTTSTTTQIPVTFTSRSTTSTTTQEPVSFTSRSTTSTTTQVPKAYTSTSTSTSTQIPYTYSSTSRTITTQGPSSYASTTTQQVPLMYQPRFAMRIPIAPPGTMSSTPSSAIRYHFILKTTPQANTNFQYNSINPVNKNTSFDKSSEMKNTTLSTLNTLSISVTSSTTISPPHNATIFKNNNEIEVTRSNLNLNSTLAATVNSIKENSSTIVSLPNVTPQTTSVPTTTKHVTTSVITNPTIQNVITTPRITTPIAITTPLISTTSTPVTSPQITAIPTNHSHVTTPHVITPPETTIRVPASTPLTTSRVTAIPTTPIPVTTPRVYTPASTTVRLSTPIPVTMPRATALPTTPIPITTPRVNTPASTTIRFTTSIPVTTPRRVTIIHTTHTPVTTPRINTSDLTTLRVTPIPLTTPRVTASHTTLTPVTASRGSTPAATTPIPVTTTRSTANSLTSTRVTHVTTPVPPTTTTVTTTRAATPIPREITSTTVTTTLATTPMQTTLRVTTPASTTHDSINDITSVKEYNVKPTDWTYKNILNIENSASSSILPLTNENVLESQRSVVQQAAPSFSLPVNPEPPRAPTADATWFAILRQLGSASFGLPAPQQLPVRTEATPRVTTTTTTTLPPRSNQQESQRTPKRQRINKPETTTVAPESASLPPAPQAEAGNTQSALVTVAINGAARTVSTVVSDSGRVFANYLQTWQIPAP
ncbi:hypothetical protein B566_EDAN005166 [Ephemera danica]|nr:hypothetical protein B566_EDAN005166 [Ephemera danica]